MESQFIPAAAHKATRRSRQRMRAIIGSAAAVLVAGLSAATPPANAAETARLNVVVLGDSYTSGHGASHKYEDDACRRSSSSYAPLFYKQLKATLQPATSEYVTKACTGATTKDVIATQLDALSDTTDLVILTAGGNDLHFANVARTCVLSSTADCTQALDEISPRIVTMINPVVMMLHDIAAKAPNADIIMSAYPLIFDTGDCGLFGIAEHNRDHMRSLQTHLNEVIQKTVAALFLEFKEEGRSQRALFADADEFFDDHRVCDDEPWINQVSDAIYEFDTGAAYHPNAEGHEAMAQAVFETYLDARTEPSS